MDEAKEEKLFKLVDVIATGVEELRTEIGELRSETRAEFAAVCTEMREGFARVDRRFSNVEARLEALESSRT